jgi:hypothetical protein
MDHNQHLFPATIVALSFYEPIILRYRAWNVAPPHGARRSSEPGKASGVAGGGAQPVAGEAFAHRFATSLAIPAAALRMIR